MDGFDATTLTRLRRRDPEAQQDLMRAQRGRLMAIATAELGDRKRAESVVEDVLVDFLFEAVDRVQAAAAVPAYLRIMTVRRVRREKERHAKHDALSDDGSEVGVVGAIDDVDHKRETAALKVCVEQLTPRARTAVRLHFAQDAVFAEVGQHLGVSKQAEHKMIEKALDLLRACIAVQLGRGDA